MLLATFEMVKIDVVDCPMCYGVGRFEVDGGNWDLSDPVNWSTCTHCNGTGKIKSQE